MSTKSFISLWLLAAVLLIAGMAFSCSTVERANVDQRSREGSVWQGPEI